MIEVWRELARLVGDDALADRLEGCYRREVKVLGLDIAERETNHPGARDPVATTGRVQPTGSMFGLC